MARPREFDRDTALRRAIETFAAHGFEGTSTPMLLEAMKIGRQSLYDTFGDKRALYLEALTRYSEDSTASTISRLFAAATVRDGLHGALHGFIDEAMADPARSCLGVHSIAELGTSAEDVNAVSAAISGKILRAFESRLREGIAEGSVRPDTDPAVGASYLLATLAGLKVAARGGSTANDLFAIANLALRALVME